MAIESFDVFIELQPTNTTIDKIVIAIMNIKVEFE